MDKQSYNNPEPKNNNSKIPRPKFEMSWFFLTIKELETISFIVGIIVGIILTLSSYTFITGQSIFNFGVSRNNTSSKQYVKIYDNIQNSPEILEGSHYKLHPEVEYRIEVINPDKYEEVVWRLIPQDFGEIDFKTEFVTTEKFFAIYKTPQVPDGSSGIIEICEYARSGLCHSLNLPELKVVISK